MVVVVGTEVEAAAVVVEVAMVGAEVEVAAVVVVVVMVRAGAATLDPCTDSEICVYICGYL